MNQITYEDLKRAFQEQEFLVDTFIPLVMASNEVRSNLIQNLIRETHINVYYRSYYVIEAVSKTNPELFYEYWDQLVSLRTHKNSYHRNIYHWILAYLIAVDHAHKFDVVKDAYFAQIRDEKMLTGLEAVKDIIKISAYRPDLEEEIIALFLDDTMLQEYTDKQIDRFHYVMMTYFETILEKRSDERLWNFVRNCCSAKNATTSKKAKQMMKKRADEPIYEIGIYKNTSK